MGPLLVLFALAAGGPQRGDFANTVTLLRSPAFLAGSLNMQAEGANIGFRVAATVLGPRLELPAPFSQGAARALRLEGAPPFAPVVIDTAPGGREDATGFFPLHWGWTGANGELELALREWPTASVMVLRARILDDPASHRPAWLTVPLP